MPHIVPGFALQDALVGAWRAIESNEPLPERQYDTAYAAQVQPSWLPVFSITNSIEFLGSEPASWRVIIKKLENRKEDPSVPL
ncbi:MAG TPA: hypothetical protein DDX92_05025 [Flavobacteriales bacterium]|jgi:hypothetical protein|nr:hypothetical protein [Flavobacteriales bacterium]